MAISYMVQGAGTYRAFGLSTDTKPESPPANCFFFEVDTGKSYRVVASVWTLNTDTQYSSWPTKVGQALKVLRVNAGETDVEWFRTFAARFANELAANTDLVVQKGSWGWYF